MVPFRAYKIDMLPGAFAAVAGCLYSYACGSCIILSYNTNPNHVQSD